MDKQISFFRGVKFAKNPKFGTLRQALERIQSEEFAKRIAACHIDISKKDWLPVFTPTGVFDHRSIEGLREYNGVICMDIDKLSEQLSPDNVPFHTPESLKEACKSIPWVYAAFVTPSGDGLKVIVFTEATPAEYRGAEEQVAKAFSELTNIHRDNGCKDIARVQYFSYDPEIYINDSAEIFPLTPVPTHRIRRNDGQYLRDVAGPTFTDILDGKKPKETQRQQLAYEFTLSEAQFTIEFLENCEIVPIDPLLYSKSVSN